LKKKNQNKPFTWLLYFAIPFVLVLGYKYLSNKHNQDYIAINNKELSTNNSKKIVPETVDYIFDVKPILSDRCYLCHGPDEGTREANLRLDIKESAYAAIGANLDKYAGLLLFQKKATYQKLIIVLL